MTAVPVVERGRDRGRCDACGTTAHNYVKVVSANLLVDAGAVDALYSGTCERCGRTSPHPHPIAVLGAAGVPLTIVTESGELDISSQLAAEISTILRERHPDATPDPLVIRREQLLTLLDPSTASLFDEWLERGLPTGIADPVVEVLERMIRRFEFLASRDIFQALLQAATYPDWVGVAEQYSAVQADADVRNLVADHARMMVSMEPDSIVPWNELDQAIRAIGSNEQEERFESYVSSRSQMFEHLDVDELIAISEDPSAELAARKHAVDELVAFFDATEQQLNLANALNLWAYLNLMESFAEPGSYEQAKDRLKRAISLAHEAHDTYQEAKCRADLAVMTMGQEDKLPNDSLVPIVKELRHAAHMFHSIREPENEYNALGNLGLAYGRMGMNGDHRGFSRSKRYLRRVIRYRRPAGGVNLGYSLEQLGAVFLQEALRTNKISLIRKASRCINDAWSAAESGHDPRLLATLASDACEIHRAAHRMARSRTDDLSEARRWCLKAIDLLGGEGAAPASNWMQLAQVEEAADDQSAQLEALRKASVVINPESGLSLWQAVYFNMGGVLARLGRWTEAAISYEVAAAAAEPHERDVSALARAGRWSAYCYARAGQPTKAIETLESWLYIEATLERRLSAMGESALGAAELILTEQDRNLLSGVAAWNQEFNGDKETAQGDFRRLAAKIRTLNPTFLRRVDYSKVSSTFSRDAPVVYLISSPSGTAIVTAAGMTDQDISLDLSEITSSDLTNLSFVVSDNGRERPGIALCRSREDLLAALDISLPIIGSDLASIVSRRLETLGARRAKLIPTGYLGLYPIHAAEFGTSRLCDSVAISYLPSVTACLTQHRSEYSGMASGGVATRKLVALANPAVHTLRPLPGAEAEVRAVTNIWPGPIDVEVGKSATRAWLEGALEPGCEVHLSVHAGMRHAPNSDSLELAFWLADGIMSAGELTAMCARSDVDSVFAASCETGVLDITADLDQGVRLSTALLEVGCQSAVTSMWPVDDAATAMLVQRYYEHRVAGYDPATSLQLSGNWLRELDHEELAQQETTQGRNLRAVRSAHALERRRRVWPSLRRVVNKRASHVNRPFYHPYYWGGLVIHGQVRDWGVPVAAPGSKAPGEHVQD